MMSLPTGLRTLGAVLAVAIASTACSSASEPAGTTRDPADADAAPAHSTEAVPLLDIPSAMTWQQLLDEIAADSELDCIADQIGDGLPGELLDFAVSGPAGVGWPVITTELVGIEVGDDRWPHELWRCMSPQTAAAVYLTVDLAALALGADLSDANTGCIEGLPSDATFAADIAERLSGETSGEDALSALVERLSERAATEIERCLRAAGDSLSASSDAAAATVCDSSNSTAVPAEEIYAAVAPSIPYVETPGGSGSGILIEGGYVLTNHHVVWPFEHATIVFPDGSEYIEAPLAAANPWADIALIGPLDADKEPLSLENGEGLPPGSGVYLIGYPAEYEYAPEPSITGGVLSRVRHWDGYDHTLLQTDSAITGGQSGGALVDSRGCVIGVSTWSWTDANFSVATSASDDAELIDSMLRGDGFSFSYADRIGDDADIAAEQVVDVSSLWESHTYVAAASDPNGVTVELDGAAGAGLWAADAAGLLADISEGLPRRVELPAPYAFVEVLGAAPGSSFTLSSTGLLVPYLDEDGVALGPDDANAGVFDYFGDVDWYSIRLEAGDAVHIWTDSIGADTYLVLYDAEGLVVAEDDDSGPVAVFGTQQNAEIFFEAPTDGTFYVEVGDYPEVSISHEYLLWVESVG